jgi:alkylated DNA repair dioxygenase AlkB
MNRKRTTLDRYFGVSAKKTKNIKSDVPTVAQELAQRLDCSVHALTENGDSWYLLKRQWWSSKKTASFDAEWNRHPTEKHKLKLYGKVVEENRWSRSWGRSYAYSGSINTGRPVQEASSMVSTLIDEVNALAAGLVPAESSYNACLQNWYEPEHTIGLHADDERCHCGDCPIFSLSWGGTRRFLFRSRQSRNICAGLYLKDGDLLVMGGSCQQTHTHEIPRWRKTKDPPTANRINWTVRAFQE